MLERIFPKQFDNTYRGYRLAIWIFVPLVLMRAIQGANSIISTRLVMTNADGISLDGMNAGGAEVALALFALLGLYVLILPLQSAVVLLRYRAMIPFMYLMMLMVQIGGRFVGLLYPIARPGGHPVGYYINLAILGLTVVGFVLSLTRRADSAS